MEKIKKSFWYIFNTNFGRLIFATIITVIGGTLMGQFLIINFFTQALFYSGLAYFFGWFLVSMYYATKNTFFNKDK